MIWIKYRAAAAICSIWQQLAESGKEQPMRSQCCGTEDFLYEDNIRFRDKCRDLGVNLTYEEEPGEHDRGYWDTRIQNVLRWLPLPSVGI